MMLAWYSKWFVICFQVLNAIFLLLVFMVFILVDTVNNCVPFFYAIIPFRSPVLQASFTKFACIVQIVV